MTMTANLADGRVLNFPDGTDPAVIQATVKRMIGGEQQLQPQPQALQPQDPLIQLQNLLAQQAKGDNTLGPQIAQLRQSTGEADTSQPFFGGSENVASIVEGQGPTGAGIGATLQNIASMGSGMIAEPVAGIIGGIEAAGTFLPKPADIVKRAINPSISAGEGAETVKSTRESLTFKPRGEEAKALQQSVGETLKPIAEPLSKAEKFLGENTLKLTGSPALAAIAHSLPTAALEAIGLKGSKALTRAKGPSNKLIEKTLVESAPQMESIKNASRAIFKELDDSGVAIKNSSAQKLLNTLEQTAKKEGIDIRVTSEAAGAIEAVKDSIGKGNPIPTSEMDTLRTIAKNAVDASNPNKARVGMAIVDDIDNFLDSIKPADINRGAKIDAREVGKKYKTARKLWGRAKRSEMLTSAIEMGMSRKAGVEKGIRNELNNLLNRKKSRKFLSKEDVAAIRKVTDGDFKQNFASLVGGMGLKLENSPSMFGSLISGGGVGAVASTIPGLAGAAAPIAIGAITVGTVAKEVAKNIAKNRAGFLDATTRAGNDGKRIVSAYLKAVPKNKRKTSDLSDLLLDQNIDLKALENIANETVKDAVKAAQFKRELLQASTALGVGGINQEGKTQ